MRNLNQEIIEGLVEHKIQTSAEDHRFSTFTPQSEAALQEWVIRIEEIIGEYADQSVAAEVAKENVLEMLQDEFEEKYALYAEGGATDTDVRMDIASSLTAIFYNAGYEQTRFDYMHLI